MLDDLAAHPATARHIAQKLAVHFVSDRPDADMTQAMSDRFLETGGNLLSVYETMLSYSAAWIREGGNVKQPIDFIGSSLRALSVEPEYIPVSNFRKMQVMMTAPLTLMGHQWGRPAGPDGLPEDDPDWITPQRLAARLQWGMTVPRRLKKVLPDPREFAHMALGHTVPEPVRFAASAAESRAEGIGIILASPAFQRM